MRDPWKLLQSAWQARNQADYDTALAKVEAARKLCAGEDFLVQGRIAHVLMQIAADRGDHALALEHEYRAVEWYQRSGDMQKVAHAKRHVADLLHQLNQFIEAQRLYDEVIEIYADHQANSLDLANALRYCALNQEELNLRVAARTNWLQALSLYRNLGIEAGVSEAKQSIERLSD